MIEPVDAFSKIVAGLGSEDFEEAAGAPREVLENAIAASAHYSLLYSKMLNGPFGPGEWAMSRIPRIAFEYALFTKQRFIAAEPYVLDSSFRYDYVRVFGKTMDVAAKLAVIDR